MIRWPKDEGLFCSERSQESEGQILNEVYTWYLSKFTAKIYYLPTKKETFCMTL